MKNLNTMAFLCFSSFIAFGQTAEIGVEGEANDAQSEIDVETPEEEKAFIFSGSVDTYFRSNINSTNIPDEGTLAPPTSFANSPGFSLGMINAIATYEGKKAGFTADLVFGPRGDEAVFGSVNGSGNPSNAAIVNQLFVFWNATDNITFTLGNFNTFLGYEVISPAGNFNYSTSYMFSYGPFSHTGIKADIGLGDKFSLMVGVFNPTDATESNPTGKYIGGAQLGYETDAGGAWLNVLLDPDYTQFDLTTGWNLSENLYAGINTTLATDNFYGFAGYFQVGLSEDFSLGIRGEYFADQGLAILETPKESSVVDFTLSANYKVGNLTIIPEIRLDSFSDDRIVITDALRGESSKSLSSFMVAAVYSF
jgi:hypothetical protein